MTKPLENLDFFAPSWNIERGKVWESYSKEGESGSISFTHPVRERHEEWRQILVEEANRRRNTEISTLIIRPAGQAPMFLDLGIGRTISFRIQNQTDSVRVFAEQEDNDLLLAVYRTPDITNLMAKDKIEGAVIKLEGGQKIKFECFPIKNKKGEIITASVRIAYREPLLSHATLRRWKQSGAKIKSLGARKLLLTPVFGVIALLLFYFLKLHESDPIKQTSLTQLLSVSVGEDETQNRSLPVNSSGQQTGAPNFREQVSQVERQRNAAQGKRRLAISEVVSKKAPLPFIRASKQAPKTAKTSVRLNQSWRIILPEKIPAAQKQ